MQMNSGINVNVDLDGAISIKEFCHRFGISTPTYYKMRAEGQGPREIRMVGSVVRIRPEAVREWLLAREDTANSAAHRKQLKARSQHALSGAAR